MDTQGRVTPEEVRSAMRALYKSDRETNLQKALLHALRDDMKPVGANGRWRPSRLLVSLSAVVLAVIATVVYFKGA